LSNHLHDAFKIPHDIIVPKPNDTIAAFGEFRIAAPIRINVRCVLAAIEFDHQLSCRTSKVGNSIPDRMLPPKFIR
jgi:hypothetical protein